jgi:hypothetical protein
MAPKIRRLALVVGLGLAALGVPLALEAADLPHPMHVPPDALAKDPTMADWRGDLEAKMDTLGARIEAQQARCKAVRGNDTALISWCKGEIAELQKMHGAYYDALARYTERIKALQKQAGASPPVPKIVAPDAGTPFPERAAQLMTALDRAAKREVYQDGALPRTPPADPYDLQETNCQAHFRALGDELAKLGLPSWNKDFPLSENGKGVQADHIFRAISAESRNAGRWREVSASEAQALANRGGIVIGGVPRNLEAKPHPRKHGHLAVVVPLPPGIDLAQFQEEEVHGQPATAGTGPFVRDGNEHRFPRDPTKPGRYELSTVGAIPASRMMAPADARYFLWAASEPK